MDNLKAKCWNVNWCKTLHANFKCIFLPPHYSPEQTDPFPAKREQNVSTFWFGHKLQSTRRFAVWFVSQLLDSFHFDQAILELRLDDYNVDSSDHRCWLQLSDSGFWRNNVCKTMIATPGWTNHQLCSMRSIRSTKNELNSYWQFTNE